MIRERSSPVWHAPEDLPRADRLSRAPFSVLGLAVVVFATVFAWLSVSRHAAFQSHAFDLGNMDQAVWSTLHGHFFRFTDMDVGGTVLTSRLAIHVEPLLLLLAPLYLLHSGPETLLVVQALVVATGAIPAYLLARAALGRAWWSLAFPCAYLLHPSLQNAMLDDFHAVALSAAFLLWAVYFLFRGRMLPFALFALLAVATKEEVGLVVAGLAMWAGMKGHWKTGVLLATVGAGWFFTSLALIIPNFNPAGHSPYLGRYAYLGHGLSGIARGAIGHPELVARTLLSEDRLRYLLDLWHPLGFTSLAGLPVLAISLPVLLINMLSADPTMYSGFYQYSAELVPIAVMASIVGISWMDRLGAKQRGTFQGSYVPILCGLVVLASLVDTRIYGFTPLAAGYLVPTAGPHQALENRMLSLLPANAVVAAADEIEPHVSDRSWVYVLPTMHPRNGPPARFVVLDASVPSLPVSPSMLHAVARHAITHVGYGIRAAADGVLVLERGSRRHTLPAAFYSFVYRVSTHCQPLDVRWGQLQLTAVVVHPRAGGTNRARPAIALETYWRVAASLPAGVHIAFHLSPPYSGTHPRFNASWMTETDSPTWDWLPLPRWPRSRTIRADSLSLLPPAGSWGAVDVAVSVTGLGNAFSATAGGSLIAPNVVRVGTITVRP